ncbi:hypothetical protein ACFLZ8_00275 [Planctomycetota bacterium]
MFIFILAWRIDAPPIPNDYTIADFRSVTADCAESYELLKILTDPNNNLIEQTSDKNTLEIGISSEEISIINEIHDAIEKGNDQEISKNLRENADMIEQAWDRTEKARDIIHQLNEFPEIADLYEPSFTNTLNEISLLIDLARLYEIYAHLHSEPDDIHQITMELVELDSVFRKFNLNARLELNKLMCYVIIKTDILSANTIANKPRVSKESIKLLANHFQSLTKQQLSMKNSLLFNYLSLKYIIFGIPKEGASKVIPVFKENSALRLYRNYYLDSLKALEEDVDIPIERLNVWPAYLPFQEPAIPEENGQMSFLYRNYNPVGSLLLMMSFNTLRITKEKKYAIKTNNDLLQIVLNIRLGRGIELQDDNMEYIIDIENKCISSPGPDGEYGTEDDIKLPINPEVLGLAK